MQLQRKCLGKLVFYDASVGTLTQLPGLRLFVQSCSLTLTTVHRCGALGQTLADRLSRLEKRAVRAVAGLSFREPMGNLTLLYSRHNLLPIQVRRGIQLASLVHRCLYGSAPKDVSVRFNSVNASNRVITRLTRSGLIISAARTSALQRTSFYRGQILWNSLPAQIRSMSKISLFKSLVEEHLLRTLSL